MGQYRTYSIISSDHTDDNTVGIVIACAEEGYANRKRQEDNRVTIRGMYRTFTLTSDDVHFGDSRFFGTMNRLGRNYTGGVPSVVMRAARRSLDDPNSLSIIQSREETPYYDLDLSQLFLSEKRRDLVQRVEEESAEMIIGLVDNLVWQPVDGEASAGRSVEKYMRQYPGNYAVTARIHGGVWRHSVKLIGGRVTKKYLRKKIIC